MVNIDHNDTLNVRSQPNYRSKKVGTLPLDAHVGIESCINTENALWCRVYPMVQQWYEEFGDNSHIGWVNTRYLEFYNSGYVTIDGKKNCDYALRCREGKCEIVESWEQDQNYNITSIKTKWIARERLRGESNFGATPDNEDGFCNTKIFIDYYLKHNTTGAEKD